MDNMSNLKNCHKSIKAIFVQINDTSPLNREFLQMYGKESVADLSREEMKALNLFLSSKLEQIKSKTP